MREVRKWYKFLIGEPEGKGYSEEISVRWYDNIRMDLSEMRWEGVDRMHLAQDRDQWRALENQVMNSCVP
jgi:hypothetical protein